jgi:hypothetical protein
MTFCNSPCNKYAISFPLIFKPYTLSLKSPLLCPDYSRCTLKLYFVEVIIHLSVKLLYIVTVIFVNSVYVFQSIFPIHIILNSIIKN